MSKKDQNETVHGYTYDSLGRQTADSVTTLGSGVDGSVRRIERQYEVRGMVAKITSYDASSGGNAVNQVVREYDAFGQLVREYQEHSGEKDANTLYVGYGYAGVDDALRLESVRYPNGRLVHYTYGTSDNTNDVLNRLDAICDDDSGSPGDVLASYTYLGLGAIVREDYEEPDIRLDLCGGTSGTYAGFDRFGRVVDHRWHNYGTSTDVDRFKYGYDRAGNRIWKENVVAGDQSPPVHLDELYEYDGMNHLIAADRGNLNATHDAIVSGTQVFSQDWDLDATGNWTAFEEDTDGDGTLDLAQTRSHNAVNEIGTIGATIGTNWADPIHDRAGNMTTIPKPSDPANAIVAKYDAWNRLVEVTDDSLIVAHYHYDGAGRRVLKIFDSHSPDDPSGLDSHEHVFLLDQQVVETRRSFNAAPSHAEGIQPRHQHVWSPRYIDALILRDENVDQDGLCDDSRMYHISDGVFSVTTLTNENSDILERCAYTAYGDAAIRNAQWNSIRRQSLYSNSTLFTGRERDVATWVYSYRSRDYVADVGRFSTRDSIRYAGSRWNQYEYVASSPTIAVDPIGKEGLQLTPYPGTGTPYDGGFSGGGKKPRECDIAAYDGLDSHVGGGSGVTAAGLKCGAIRMVGKENIVNMGGSPGLLAAVNLANAKGCCIKTLHIMDHGCSGGTWLGAGNNNNLSAQPNLMKHLCASLCQEATIHSWGCEAAWDYVNNPKRQLNPLLSCAKGDGTVKVQACWGQTRWPMPDKCGKCAPKDPYCTGGLYTFYSNGVVDKPFTHDLYDDWILLNDAISQTPFSPQPLLVPFNLGRKTL